TLEEIVLARRRNQRPRRARYPIHLAAIFLFAASTLFAAEVIPPKPVAYFNDYAGVVSTEAAHRFNEQLAQFERDTSNQVVVAVFPKMQSDDDVAAYTQRVAQSWAVGQKEKRNGVVLFVFTQDRKMFIQVGYGLEGALPDLTAFDITEHRIKPHFRSNDYEGGLAEGIDSIFKAIRGEYQGTGKTVRESYQLEKGNTVIPNIMFFFFFVMFLFFMSRLRKQRGYRYSSVGGPYVGGWSSGGGGWSSGDGGGFSGFSGGGGSFGGGGAGSSW
ncbi:MAG TPA: TPM domain-containing protein, partial [Chthoniobacterales bacterium]|nr:TPM domain-containing protein [Chthoniobacterales bacterium]